MRLFLDSSVMIAGAASAEGASRLVFRLAGTHEWRLVTTPYAVEETVRNLAAFPPSVTASWLRLRSQLVVVDDVVTIDKPAVFSRREGPTHSLQCLGIGRCSSDA